MTETPWWLDQDAERTVALAGWIGEHPATGADVAHLLLHPTGDSIVDHMRTLAGALGLTRADAGTLTDVPPETMHATLDAAPEGRSVWLHMGDRAWAHRPVPPEWEGAATAHRYIILSCGLDGLDAHSIADIDRYVARAHRVYLGRIRLV